MPKAPHFNNNSNKEFVTVLKERVEDYFKSKRVSKHANAVMVFKTIFHLGIWTICYGLILFLEIDLYSKIFLWAILGLAIALTAVNIGHDAIHGAYSKKTWINKLLSLTYDLHGASSYMWKITHNTAHHTYTNIHEHDGDLELIPIIRLSPKQQLKPIHRFQHIFTFFIYSFATLFWVFTKDYLKFFKNKIGNYKSKKHSKQALFNLLFNKSIYYILLIILPIIMVYSNQIELFIYSFLIMHFVAGLTLALIFALAHLVENTHFPEPNKLGSIENSWAVHQLYTTSNFASKSKLAGFLTGGLNTQVEHHLFPNICSIHYKNIAPIVKQTAIEFNLPYLEYPTFYQALRSHIRFLKKMGLNEKHTPVI